MFHHDDSGAGARSVRLPARTAPLRRSAATAALLAVAVLSACTGETGTEVVPAPSNLVRLSAETDTVQVGQTADPPMSVRVENSLGEPVEGVPVRFIHASGPGRVAPNLQVSNDRGVAEADFTGGSQFGRSRVRVDVPSATNVSSLSFEVLTVPADEVRLERTGGVDQQAEVGSQLPLPFELGITAPNGTPAAGVPVAWELTDASGGARLASDTTFTDGEGRTENLLTLGGEPVDHVVRAWAVGEDLATDTVRFEAAALTVLSGPARIDSVSPVPLRAGGEATLHGEGFGLRAENVEVRVEGATGTVLEVSSDRVRFRVPRLEDRCLPPRRAGVRALVRGEPSNGKLLALDPDRPELAMAPGDVRTLRGTDASECLAFGASDQPRSYLVVAGTGSRAAGTRTPLRLLLRAGSDSAAGSEASMSVEARPSPEPTSASRFAAEARLRERSLRALERAGLGPRQAGGRLQPGAAAAERADPPARGDTLSFRFAVGEDLSVSCRDTSRTLDAVVRAVGDRVLIAADTAAPGGGFTDEQWTRLRDEFDQVVLPTDSAYFGGPADLDGNGRVTLLFTPRVNALTPRNAESRVGGFFLPLDLVDSGDPAGSGLQGPDGQACAASNEGEVLYLATPDPGGEFSSPLTALEALRDARAVAAHELEHLLSAQQRLVFGNGSFDDLGATWLQEGLAHFAEEVVGLRMAGLEPGQNLTWEDVSTSREQLDLFNIFHLENFARLNFFLLDPTAAPTLARTTPGGLSGLQMRGFAWAFVRWLAERAGGEEETAALVRRLSRGGTGHVAGVENVLQAVGGSWDALVADFLLALALDDEGLEGEAGERGLVTWHLSDVFAALAENPGTRTNFPRSAPLSPTRLPFGNASLEFETSASSATYLRLEDRGEGRPLTLRLGSQTGSGIPTSANPVVSVVRLE